MPTSLLPRLHRAFDSRLPLSTRVPTVLLYHSTGISTCCPSTTSFDLALGPELPIADQLYSGNLRYSAGRIPTFLSLLIPAFSLLKSPLLLPVQLLPFKNAHSGNLRYSAGRIPTFLSLLIPAFSLLKSPLLLPVQLLPFKNAPLPIDYSIPQLR